MQNLLKTLMSGFKTFVDKRIKVNQADWTLNDSGAGGFVRNRTHWEEDRKVTLVENLTYESYNNGKSPKCTFTIGNKYDVLWNGKWYRDLVCHEDDGHRVISNSSCPFYIDDGGDNLYISCPNDNWSTVSIYENQHIVHQLDGKFLPDFIEKDFDSIHQEVKLLKERRPDWEQHDSTSGEHIKGRTHYDSRQLGNLLLSFTSSGYSVKEGDMCVRRINNYNMPFAINLNSYYQVEINNISYTGKFKKILNNTTYSIGDGDTFSISYIPISYRLEISIRDDIYSDSGNDIKIYYVSGELVQLDSKYLPDALVEDIKSIKQDLAGKMDNADPSGTGSLSINRQEGSDIGDCSTAIGKGTVANRLSGNVTGQFNKYDTTKYIEVEDESNHVVNFHTPRKFNHSSSYSFDSLTGTFSLVGDIINCAPSQVSDGTYTLMEGVLKDRIYQKLKFDGQRYTYKVIYAAPATSAKGEYLHAVGNGTSDTERSNAHTLDWDGTAWYAGDVYVGSHSGTEKDEGSRKLMKEPTSDEIIDSLLEADLLPAVSNESGAILTDENGNVVLRY